MSRKVQLELLPHERAIVLKWNYTPEVQNNSMHAHRAMISKRSP